MEETWPQKSRLWIPWTRTRLWVLLSNLIPNSDSDMNLSQTLGLPEGGLGTQLVALRLPEQILQRSDGQSLPVN